MRLLYLLAFLITSSALKAQTYNVQDSINLKKVWAALDGPSWETNNWTGPISSWSGLRWSEGRLTSISIREPKAHGVLPPEIGELSKLTTITMIAVKLDKTLPAEINNLKELTSLYIQDGGREDKFEYSLPDLSGLTSLRAIRLQKWKLALEKWPEWMRTLPSLESINLGDVRISEAIPQWLVEKSSLRSLILFNNNIPGTLPDFSSNSSITDLYILRQNMDEQPFPSWLSSMENLELIGLGGVNLTGDFPEDPFGKMKNLKRLTFSRNYKLNGDYNQLIKSEFPALVSLIVTESKLTGHLDSEKFNADQLAYVDVSKNRLSSFGDFTAFENLSRFLILRNAIDHKNIEEQYDVLKDKGLFYKPQAFGELYRDTIYPEETIVLDAMSSGENDTYTWYKNGNKIDHSEKTLALNYSDEVNGRYYCEIKNEKLDLTSKRAQVTIVKGQTSSNDVVNEIAVNIYPNPTSSFLNIDSDQEVYSFIYDAKGVLISSSTDKRYDLSGYASGIYTVVIRTDNGYATKKVIRL